MNLTSAEKTRDRPSTWWYIWQLAKYKPWVYGAFGLMEILIFGVFPQLSGFVIQAIFNQLSGEAQTGFSLWALAAFLVTMWIAALLFVVPTSILSCFSKPLASDT